MMRRREEMLVIEIYDDGRGSYVVDSAFVNNIKGFVEGLRSDYEGEEGEWFYEEEENGWVKYGFEGSEVWGMVKEISVEEKEKYENMSVDELQELVDSIWG
jgi:hypothetical protein